MSKPIEIEGEAPPSRLRDHLDVDPTDSLRAKVAERIRYAQSRRYAGILIPYDELVDIYSSICRLQSLEERARIAARRSRR